MSEILLRNEAKTLEFEGRILTGYKRDAMGYSSAAKFGSVELQMGSIKDYKVRRASTPITAVNA